MESSTKLLPGRFSGYFKLSGSAYYGVVTAIPMLLIYEALLFTGGNPLAGQVRNAGDVWLRQILESLEIRQTHAAMVMLLGLVIAMVVLRRGGMRLKGSYLAIMAAEATAYGILLGVVQSVVSAISFYVWETHAATTALPMAGGVGQGIALSLGAGLFEEFIFRVVLLWALLQAAKPLLPGYLATAAAIGVAAGLFSAAHYIGPLGDTFHWSSFMFRFVAGVLFTGLYYLRGFSITAYTHAIYDIRVILF